MSLIDLDKIRRTRKVFYHKNCADGTAAALICAAAFKHIGLNNIKYYSVQYGNSFYRNLTPEYGHLFVDIIPPENRWEEWKNYDPIVLDHHVGVQNITENIGGVFDINKSGAMLAFEHIMIPLIGDLLFEKYLMWNRVAHLAMVYDLWKQDHTDWIESEYLTHGLNFIGDRELLNNVQEFDMNKILEIGKLYKEKIDQKAKVMARNVITRTLNINGNTIKWSLYNCSENIFSQVCHEIIHGFGSDIAIGYFMTVDNGHVKYVFSVRSKTMNLLDFVKSLNGGGHEVSAGFTLTENCESLSLNQIITIIEDKMNTHINV